MKHPLTRFEAGIVAMTICERKRITLADAVALVQTWTPAKCRKYMMQEKSQELFQWVKPK